MSTLFGEIVEPTSRNAWEDWDEYDTAEQTETASLAWAKETENSMEIDTFYILEGKHLSSCVQTQINVDLIPINSVPQINLSLFRLKNTDNYLCSIKNKNEVMSGDMVELLRHFISTSTNIVTVQSLPLADFKSKVFPESCVIRCVNTSKPVLHNPALDFPKLEQPNIISGVSAGAICLREHLGLGGKAIIAYLEYPEEDLSEVQILLEKLNIFQTLKKSPISTMHSNLYI